MEGKKKGRKENLVVCDGGRFDALVDELCQGRVAKRNLACLCTRVYADRFFRQRGARSGAEVLVRVGPQPCDDAVHGGFPDEERARVCARLRSEAGVSAEWAAPASLSTDALLALCRETGARVFLCKAQQASDSQKDMFRARVLDDRAWLDRKVDWHGVLALLAAATAAGPDAEPARR
jgi:hypothetical protein